MNTSEDFKCELCLYFESDDSSCRLNAPTRGGHRYPDGWPVISKEAWCSHWQHIDGDK